MQGDLISSQGYAWWRCFGPHSDDSHEIRRHFVGAAI